MSAICLIDTSIFLNILNVPGRNNEVAQVTQSYQEYVELGCTFILPMATILETGNHIAQNGNGAVRLCTAKRFCEAVAGAFSGEAPWRPSEFPNSSEVTSWINEFPPLAGQNKSPSKTTEGTSFGDLSIIKEYEKCLRKFSMSEVFIWSLDSDLCNYHRKP
ncbi:hypothetical protein D6Z43_13725 [Pseudomonas sp. DY-1]|uniref:hypothetical protein n=1 Tax=Pseudomonas sp. DY-1 TaxID=1755504 RepID=UPI000EAA1BA3|nr:hypothetical protein [Pseudomonas sp. DY-1]AYF88156.1 hypothetical protein D6Z43_13725 [Pseudomonas sp. DY-1]